MGVGDATFSREKWPGQTVLLRSWTKNNFLTVNLSLDRGPPVQTLKIVAAVLLASPTDNYCAMSNSATNPNFYSSTQQRQQRQQHSALSHRA